MVGKAMCRAKAVRNGMSRSLSPAKALCLAMSLRKALGHALPFAYACQSRMPLAAVGLCYGTLRAFGCRMPLPPKPLVRSPKPFACPSLSLPKPYAGQRAVAVRKAVCPMLAKAFGRQRYGTLCLGPQRYETFLCCLCRAVPMLAKGCCWAKDWDVPCLRLARAYGGQRYGTLPKGPCRSALACKALCLCLQGLGRGCLALS